MHFIFIIGVQIIKVDSYDLNWCEQKFKFYIYPVNTSCTLMTKNKTNKNLPKPQSQTS